MSYKRTVMSGGDEGGSSSSSFHSSSSSSSSSGSRHQVFRGMSPTTSSRLENRVKELEEALEQERSAHFKTSQELTEFRYSFESLNERLEESESETSVQIEKNRVRELDFIKLKKDFEVNAAQYEANESSLKKRHQEIINDLTEQLERSNKQRTKVEKEKQQITIEIENYSSQLEVSNKAKSYAESKLEGLEEQLHRFKSQVDDLTRSNQELTSIKIRLTNENSELQRQLQESETSSGSSTKIKIQLQSQLDDVKQKFENETRIRIQLESQFNILQDEFSSLRSQLDEESEAASSFKLSSQKWQADFQQLKSKYDKDIITSHDELEEIRRKLTARITELESELEQAKNRASRAEKEKSKLTIEINEFIIQLESANNVVNDQANRLKKGEHAYLELQRHADDLAIEVRTSGADHEKAAAELIRLRQTVGDQETKIDTLSRENARLLEANRELESSIKDLTRQTQELTTIKITLISERDGFAANLEETQESLRDLHSRLDAANSALNQGKSDSDALLRAKDDEIEGYRRSSQKTIDDLQRTIIEIETRSKGESSRIKKKFETEIHEFEIQIDELNRSNGELAKNNKSLSTKLKDTEAALELEHRAAQEARDSATAFEKKIISLQTTIEDIHIQLASAEKARKYAESSLSESSVQINEINITITSLTNDKRRLEGDVASAQRDRDEAVSARRAADERADKLSSELSRVSEQLRSEQETTTRLETTRKQLEVSVREMTIRIEHIESSKDGKKSIANLQTQITELESELELVTRRERDSSAENVKLKRQLLELRAQADSDHTLVIEYTERINVLQLKIVSLRQQFEHTEEVLNITMGKYRKTQQLLEESERRADRAENSVTIVRRQSVVSSARPSSFSSSNVSIRSSSTSRDSSRGKVNRW